jgi:hypothetical protein
VALRWQYSPSGLSTLPIDRGVRPLSDSGWQSNEDYKDESLVNVRVGSVAAAVLYTLKLRSPYAFSQPMNENKSEPCGSLLL